MKRKRISRDGPGTGGANKIIMSMIRPERIDKEMNGALPGNAKTRVNQNLQWKSNEKNSLAFIIEQRRAKDMVEETEKSPLEKIVAERRSHDDEMTTLERIIEERNEQGQIMELQNLSIETIIEARRRFEDKLSPMDKIIEERKNQERKLAKSERDIIVNERRSQVDEKTNLDTVIDIRREAVRAAEY